MTIKFDGKYTIVDFGRVMFVFGPMDYAITAILILSGIYLLLTGF